MEGIMSLGYLLRDLTIFVLSFAIVLMLLAVEKNVKRNLRVKYFSRVFDLLLGAFLLVVIAEFIGVLMRTSLLYGNSEYALLRSALLTVSGIMLFVSSIMVYIPFAKGKYVVVPIATEPSGEFESGGYWGDKKDTERLFVELTKHRHLPGIAITRDLPEVFRKRLGLRIVPVIWISKVKHPDAVAPTRLPYLLETLRAFLESTELDKVILIDCIEYLILENGPESVLKFVASLRDLATLHRGILLVSIDWEALDEKMFSMFTSELNPIEELEKVLTK
ncbi:DUF835 domain-containing protein [Thermococcus sp.]